MYLGMCFDMGRLAEIQGCLIFGQTWTNPQVIFQNDFRAKSEKVWKCLQERIARAF